MGYPVEQSRQSYAMAHLILRYVNTRVEATRSSWISTSSIECRVLHPASLSLATRWGRSAAPATPTFALDELAASKIVALARRGLARDLFDVGELARVAGLDRGVVRTVLVFAAPRTLHHRPISTRRTPGQGSNQ